jgi:DNA replication protein DnaC
MNPHLEKVLKQLRLSGLASSLEIRLQEAAGNRLSHVEFLELIMQDELAVRRDRLHQRRLKQAAFRERKTLEDFNWSFNTSIPRKRVYDLATGAFLREGKDVLFLGPPGTGKSHLVQAIGYAVIKAGFAVMYRSIFDVVRDFLHDEALGGEDKVLARYLKPDLVIIDDMGMKQLPKRSGEYLFEIIMRRHELRSTIMTSNRPLEDWGKLVGDVPAATAILDRFLERAELIQITGRSYRLRQRAGEADTSPEGGSPASVKTDQSARRVDDGKTDQSAHRVEEQPSPERSTSKKR